MRRLVIGTRGSELARAQTALVEAAIRHAHPDVQVAIEIITTSGDQGAAVRDVRQGLKGMFTREIERALLDGKIDVAVHSAKDLPSEATPDLTIAAVLPRGPIEDVLVAKAATELPPGATVATGSVRRHYQLRMWRPDLKLVALRGNVPTRLRKLLANNWDAIVLARAGLERLGFDCARGAIEFEGEQLRTAFGPNEQFLPAGGQGVIAVQTRREDAHLLVAIDHVETHSCLRAEREFLRRLNGDCGTPVGVLATIQEDAITLRAQVFTENETEPKTGAVRGQQPEETAQALFEQMYGDQD